MRRTIEKLIHQRKEKEGVFKQEIDGIKKKISEIPDIKKSHRLDLLISDLEEESKAYKKSYIKKSTPFSLKKISPKKTSPEGFGKQTLLTIKELRNALDQSLNQIKDILASLTALNEVNTVLVDAKDREWDALSNNHVGMIFKSMEWRVDKLAAECQDANMLMKKFLLLKEKLNRLISILEEKKMPTPYEVKELNRPLEDWYYAGFENRHRGNEEDVRKQQSLYLPYFKNGKKVLDLGCGRGEFLELLEENGIEAEGIDINDQMIEICRNKGLKCEKADILEKLASYKDDSLGGIFSSQVIEHLLPSYFKRMIELAYFKLVPSSYILIETINPASVFALVQIYLLDFSHQRPVHPQALKFLLESVGFDEVEIKYSSPLEEERLRELPGAGEIISPLNQNIDRLNTLLYSPVNYAAIGLKK